MKADKLERLLADHRYVWRVFEIKTVAPGVAQAEVQLYGLDDRPAIDVLVEIVRDMSRHLPLGLELQLVEFAPAAPRL